MSRVVLISSYTSHFDTWIIKQVANDELAKEALNCCFLLRNLLVVITTVCSCRERLSVHLCIPWGSWSLPGRDTIYQGKLVAWVRPGTSGEAQVDGCLHHERTMVTTLGDLLWHWPTMSFSTITATMYWLCGWFPRFQHWTCLQPLNATDPCTCTSHEQHCQDILLWSQAWCLFAAMITPIPSKRNNFKRHLPIFL